MMNFGGAGSLMLADKIVTSTTELLQMRIGAWSWIFQHFKD
jgi:hypothetical protein